MNILKEAYHYFLALRMFVYNKIINRIPFAVIRLPLMRLYITIGRDTNILTNVELLSSQ